MLYVREVFLQISKAAVYRCSSKQFFLKIVQISRENSKILQNMYLLVKFSQNIRKSFLQNTSSGCFWNPLSTENAPWVTLKLYYYVAVKLLLESTQKHVRNVAELREYLTKLQHQKISVRRSSHQRCSIKKVFLKVSQNSQENKCARVPFLIKLQGCNSF